MVHWGNLTVSGSNISLRGQEIENIGDEPAEASHVGYYASLDPQITRDDYFLGEDPVAPLEPGEKSVESFQAQLSELPDGTYYIGMVVDYKGEVPESSGEDNFCHYATPRVTIGNSTEDKANLVCGDLGTLRVDGLNLSITNFEIKNTGTAVSENSHVGFYLSSDREINRNDFYLGGSFVGSIRDFDSEIVSFQTRITGVPDGTYYVGAVVDDRGEVPETSGEDNFCLYESPKVNIGSSSENKPNIVCGDLGILQFNGSTVTISALEILNQGSGPAGSSHVGFFLSADSDIQRDDILIGEAKIGPLAAGATNSQFFSTSVSEQKEGSYYLGVIVDYKGEVPETSGEDNFCYYDSPKIDIRGSTSEELANIVCGDQGDLIVNGNSISISNLEVRNIGGTRAQESHIGYYLSSDTDISRNDIFLGEDRVRALNPGESSFESFQQSISGVSNGTYYVGIVVDYKGEVPETSGEDNFCHYQSPRVVIGNTETGQPNLVCVNNGSLSIRGNELFIDGVDICNVGDARSGSSHVGFYLSPDRDISRNDIFIGEERIDALDVSEPESCHTLNLSLNYSNVADGTYYLGMVVDYKGEVTETSGEDNFCYFSSPLVRINTSEGTLANMVCGALGSLTVNGNNISISNLEVKNTGGTESPVSHIGYYLSTDTDISRDDIYLGEDQIGRLAPGESSFESFQHTVSGVSNGNYYVGVVVDYKGEVPETSGEDNFCYFSSPLVRINTSEGTLANMVCGALGSLTVNGNNISISNLEVKNTGGTESPVSHIGYYLSTDTDISRDDIYLGEDQIGRLAPGESSFESFQHTVSGVSNGNYYVGVVVDYKGEVPETSGEDNFCYFSSPLVRINTSEGTLANMVCGALGSLTVNGNNISISNLEVKNTGGTESPVSHIGYYLSTDTDISRDDIYLGEDQIGRLAPGESSFESFQHTVSGVSNGNYYVGVVVDYKGEVPETSGEDNFCRYDAPLVQVNSIAFQKYSVNRNGSFEESWPFGLQIFPIPTAKTINLSLVADNTQRIEIEILDSRGKVVRTKTLFPKRQGEDIFETFDVSRYSKGLYLLKLRSGERLFMRQIILTN